MPYTTPPPRSGLGKSWIKRPGGKRRRLRASPSISPVDRRDAATCDKADRPRRRVANGGIQTGDLFLLSERSRVASIRGGEIRLDGRLGRPPVSELSGDAASRPRATAVKALEPGVNFRRSGSSCPSQPGLIFSSGIDLRCHGNYRGRWRPPRARRENVCNEIRRSSDTPLAHPPTHSPRSRGHEACGDSMEVTGI